MGLGTIISNYAGDQAKTKPHRIFILILIVIILLLYSQRIFGITNPYYNTYVACGLILIASLIILSTFLSILHTTDNEHISNFNNIFNSPSSKNFFAVFLLIIFIMFIYEIPMYDNNNPHSVMDKLLFGYNGVFSNRLIGVILIFGFGISTAYMIHSTTRDPTNE